MPVQTVYLEQHFHEAVSWGKIDPEELPSTIVCSHTDSMIALPLLTAYVLNQCQSASCSDHDRPPEEMMGKTADTTWTPKLSQPIKFLLLLPKVLDHLRSNLSPCGRLLPIIALFWVNLQNPLAIAVAILLSQNTLQGAKSEFPHFASSLSLSLTCSFSTPALELGFWLSASEGEPIAKLR